MKTIRKVIALFVLAVLLAGMVPDFAYAAKNDPVKFTVSSTLFVMQGASSYVNVEAAAADDLSYKLILECDDKNIVMDNGKIVDSGTHQELMERSPIYQEVCTSQKKGGDDNG